MSDPHTQTFASLPAALENAGRFLDREPRIAALQAVEILKSIPDQPGALLILGTPHRRLGELGRARTVLERLVQLQPAWADGFYQLGLALAGLGEPVVAQTAFRRALARNSILTMRCGLRLQYAFGHHIDV